MLAAGVLGLITYLLVSGLDSFFEQDEDEDPKDARRIPAELNGFLGVRHVGSGRSLPLRVGFC